MHLHPDRFNLGHLPTGHLFRNSRSLRRHGSLDSTPCNHLQMPNLEVENLTNPKIYQKKQKLEEMLSMIFESWLLSALNRYGIPVEQSILLMTPIRSVPCLVGVVGGDCAAHRHAKDLLIGKCNCHGIIWDTMYEWRKDPTTNIYGRWPYRNVWRILNKHGRFHRQYG